MQKLPGRHEKLKRIARLGAGLSALALLIFLFGFVEVPGGVIGAVVRHAIDEGIDATPYFYTECDEILDIESDLHDVLQEAFLKAKNDRGRD